MTTTAKVYNLLYHQCCRLSDETIDCSGAQFRYLKRIWLCVIHRFRSLRRCNRVYEWPISHEQIHHSAICIQKRRQGGTARDTCRTSPCGASQKEQRAPRRCSAASRANGVRGSPTSTWLPRSVSRAICGRSRFRHPSCPSSGLHTSADCYVPNADRHGPSCHDASGGNADASPASFWCTVVWRLRTSSSSRLRIISLNIDQLPPPLY